MTEGTSLFPNFFSRITKTFLAHTVGVSRVSTGRPPITAATVSDRSGTPQDSKPDRHPAWLVLVMGRRPGRRREGRREKRG